MGMRDIMAIASQKVVEFSLDDENEGTGSSEISTACRMNMTTILIVIVMIADNNYNFISIIIKMVKANIHHLSMNGMIGN